MPITRIEAIPITITSDFSVSPVIYPEETGGVAVDTRNVYKTGDDRRAVVFIGFDENDEPVCSLRVVLPKEQDGDPDSFLGWLSA